MYPASEPASDSYTARLMLTVEFASSTNAHSSVIRAKNLRTRSCLSTAFGRWM